MKRKKRRNIIIWSVVALIVVIAGYFSFIHPQQQAKRTVTVGIMAGSKQDDEIWNSVSKTAKDKYNVTLKFKRFTDYNQPNKALENGDVDLNAFQHKLFLQTWNKAHKTDLVSLGDTFITPIRLYSKQYKSVKEIPNGGTIAVPNQHSLMRITGIIRIKECWFDRPKEGHKACNCKFNFQEPTRS